MYNDEFEELVERLMALDDDVVLEFILEIQDRLREKRAKDRLMRDARILEIQGRLRERCDGTVGTGSRAVPCGRKFDHSGICIP